MSLLIYIFIKLHKYSHLHICLVFLEQNTIWSLFQDMESEPIVMSYSKNGEDLGTCFEVEKSSLGEAALFPHILTKNTEFECNFGQNVRFKIDWYTSM